MIKILQYGEGNFLRAFVDAYIQTLKGEGGDYGVYVVKPRPTDSSRLLAQFERQANQYHVILRGAENGAAVEKVCKIDCLKKVINPFADHAAYIALAADPELKLIVSNTTEAGICYSPDDSMDDFDHITFPAKLTKFLYERYNAGLSGVYILPVELIDNNADELRACVERYITLWGLPDAFRYWHDSENVYCNTLVDRIVSGYPREASDKTHLEALIGEQDALMTVGEPFGLWVIENKADIADYVKEGIHDIEVVLTDDIGYYKKRKVRVLNGSHTNLVPAGLMFGAKTVYDCMVDQKLSAFLERTLQNEIIPYISNDTAITARFAEQVKDRFLNPYLNHQLVSISLNSISKWKARVLPSFKDYYRDHEEIAPNLTVGFSYLMALYSGVEKTEGRYYARLQNGTIELCDEPTYLEHFAAKRSIADFMSDVTVWGEDLTQYRAFCETVMNNVEKIKKGICLL
ncbi:MAG: tagaturonate reductase [Clostridia bacterium]|nr:tagaturonate reductase [Clostridia bacterium]